VTGPMVGIRVVELGQWVAGPSAAAILGDWGAEVVKIEAPSGDPLRGVGATPGGAGVTPPQFEVDNRGKRSIALNLQTPEAREVAARLVARADVFITNVRPASLERAGLDYATLHSRHPELIYGLATAYGLTSSERDRAAFDVGAFWARAGLAASLTYPGGPTPVQRGGMGDHNLGAQLAGGVAAALFHRARGGSGQLVSGSLLRTGVYTLAWDLNAGVRTGVAPELARREAPASPLMAWYDTADDRRIWLLMLQGPRHWPDFARAMEHEDWLSDPRFATWPELIAHRAELAREISALIRSRTLEEWGATFDRHNVWWAPVQTQAQVLADPVAAEAGAWTEVPTSDGPARMVATPIDFSETPWAIAGPVPEVGQHTEEVLGELGYDWDEIVRLRENGAIP
jgi:crotonobetainyl-CoA:carnitine CoA-transferase CaiB-like acyl-CoA transferase